MVTELGDGVWWYDLRGVNAFLVDDGGTLTLVDTGNPWDADTLLGGLADCGYAPAALDRILVTHYDVDHVGGLGKLSGVDATVYVGAADAPLLTGEERPPIRNRKGLIQTVARPLLSTPDLSVETVADGDEVGSFTAIHTPGHTPGHTVYVSDTLDAAFLGDLVRESGGELVASPWVMSYDTVAVSASVRTLAERAPPFEVAAMGHGVPFREDGSERLQRLADSL